MRTFSRWLVLATALSGAAAHADDNDLQIARFGIDRFGQDNAAALASADFRAFARTFGAVINSANLMPPRTTGHSGYAFNAELSVVSLPDSVFLPTEREQPGSVLLPSVHVRKGLPFSLELGGRVGWVEKSGMVTAMGELKWAVNEGFTYLPDVGVRLHVTKLFGAHDLDLTTTGLDIGVGKQFPLGGMITLTPYGGLDLAFVRATSRTLIFNPNLTLEESQDDDSRATLANGNAGTYARVSAGDNLTPRFYAGARFIGGALQLGAEFSVTSLGSFDVTGEASRDLPSVVAFNTTLGLDF
ncbi:hypothetical protein D7Y13_34335 [Corallococcus praedator]|uniref:Outer membrane beta-barrel porin/alpha-amylase n=1 Tax=Corallococcus praedator TaxID=2316724 RepID=A0ABX9Q9R2_9BACT|nr:MULTISPECIES: hypothetical protein [Corallococcus]RKH09984.1 hypothetical protein D7X74_28370 [Corallococcus sp. CA047B]RKH25337.1 hypothetical protein D7X75_30265 [Corallococcus sp. CA031C]RKH93468.1 hypothetical protein D7Y13_34335 [Corallococcus praedator]